MYVGLKILKCILNKNWSFKHETTNCNYRIAQNFGGRKLYQSWNCKKIGGENFGG